MMRRDGTAKADLVLDNTVCGSNQRDQGKTWFSRTYVGTGERISK